MPSAGEVALFGAEVAGMSRDDIAKARQRMGIVHQDCTFLDHLTVADNISLPLTVSGRHIVLEQLSELLAWVGLAPLTNARQRAALARAVMMSPDVILADEPTGNVDWDMSVRLLTLLVELNRMGKAVVVATHDLNLIRAAKSMVSARVLRIADQRRHLAGGDL